MHFGGCCVMSAWREFRSPLNLHLSQVDEASSKAWKIITRIYSQSSLKPTANIWVYGEIKASLEEQHVDRLRLGIFSKDILDLFERTLENTPPVPGGGRKDVFFFTAKIGNTILHCNLSSFSMPVTLAEMDPHDAFFPPLFQVQSLIRLTKEALNRKREVLLVIDTFPLWVLHTVVWPWIRTLK